MARQIHPRHRQTRGDARKSSKANEGTRPPGHRDSLARSRARDCLIPPNVRTGARGRRLRVLGQQGLDHSFGVMRAQFGRDVSRELGIKVCGRSCRMGIAERPSRLAGAIALMIARGARRSPRRTWPAISGTGSAQLRPWVSMASASQRASASASGALPRDDRRDIDGRPDCTPLPGSQHLGGVADVLEHVIERQLKLVKQSRHRLPAWRDDGTRRGRVNRWAGRSALGTPKQGL
jgi:hypothetical protein